MPYQVIHLIARPYDMHYVAHDMVIFIIVSGGFQSPHDVLAGFDPPQNTI